MAEPVVPINAFLPVFGPNTLQNALINSTQNRVDEGNFLPTILPPDLEAQALPGNDNVQPDIITETLIQLDKPTIELFNDIVNEQDPNPNANGVLTPEQLQELAILQQDVQGLEEASLLEVPLALTPNATTVDLSAQAQTIVQNTPVIELEGIPLTQPELTQLTQIVAPLENQPLTPELLLQIQAQLAAAQLNPLLLNLNTLLSVQSFIAGLQQPMRPAMEMAAEEEEPKTEENKDDVPAVQPVWEITPEDSVIA